jgi:hypothetical protein
MRPRECSTMTIRSRRFGDLLGGQLEVAALSMNQSGSPMASRRNSAGSMGPNSSGAGSTAWAGNRRGSPSRPVRNSSHTGNNTAGNCGRQRGVERPGLNDEKLPSVLFPAKESTPKPREIEFAPVTRPWTPQAINCRPADRPRPPLRGMPA